MLDDPFLRAEFEAFQTAPRLPVLRGNWLWAEVGTALRQRLDALEALLQPDAALTVTNTDDELLLHLYDRPGTPFLAAQWHHALRDLSITESFNAPRLLKPLLTLRTTNEEPLRHRILALDAVITTLATKEAALNATIYNLYRLTTKEVGMVEAR